MTAPKDLFAARKSLDEICTVPERIISVYSLEKHVWADGNSLEARRTRTPELQTIEEFQIDPVRPFLNDVLRNIAAPYRPERRDSPIGQGYWIQAEFGSGKSHLLCLLAALALGNQEAWDLVAAKEQKAGRGRRESIYRFWEEGIAAKSRESKGVFVIVKTLVGAGGGTVGLSDKGQCLTKYILDAAREQIELELGKSISLYPTELLADRFLHQDLERYRTDLRKFLRSPRFFVEDQFEEVDDFLRDIQQEQSVARKRSCGNKLWQFYTEYLQVQPQIPAETEDVLRHLVETLLAEGYAGVLLVLDEVSLFMKNRDDEQRVDDEKTLVVLSNRLAKVHNLPIWTVCAAQQAIESKMGVKNILADDRLKLVKLLEEDRDYYQIVLNRVRAITDPTAIAPYYLHYRRGFSWPDSVGEEEFARFFPFHKPALEVLRAITYELTTTRSAIHFMHQTLKHQRQVKGNQVIRLWELFDEAVRYEEDPSGVHAGLIAIKTKKEGEFRAYEQCKRQIDALTKGDLKFHRDKAVQTVQTLFLYHVARTRQQGITPEEIANSVLVPRDDTATPDENNQHYETLAEHLKRELRQVVLTTDDEGRQRYRFEPVVTGIDPRDEFKRVRDEAEGNEVLRREAWIALLGLGEWPVRTRQMTLDLSNGVRSLFRGIAPGVNSWEGKLWAIPPGQEIELVWNGRQVNGIAGMYDLNRAANENVLLPAIDTDQTDRDFAVFVGIGPATPEVVQRVLQLRKDPRIIVWAPDTLTADEQSRLLDFAAYRKLVQTWQGKDSEDAVTMLNWISASLQTDMGRIARIVPESYARGRMDSANHSDMEFHVAGDLTNTVSPVVERVLNACYVSNDVRFDPPLIFRKEEAVKVINGIVKVGKIPKDAKPNQNISAVMNFGFGLRILRRGAERELDVRENQYVTDIAGFVEEKAADSGQGLKIETLYKNFMGIGGPKDYGLTRRMVQIYLLCLVQQGRIRVKAGPKSGLTVDVIDYSNISDIEFSAKVLDGLTEVQRVEQPENWEQLRPYAEKLLDEAIPVGLDEGAVADRRRRLRDLFETERETAARVKQRAADLFQALGVANPYASELEQVAGLFQLDMRTGDDIGLLLYRLHQVFGYQVVERGTSDQGEVDDLANRLRAYRDVERFLNYEGELKTLAAYTKAPMPDVPELADVRAMVAALSAKLGSIREYVDSEVKLKTELLGQTPPVAGERGTLSVLLKEYTPVYVALHDNVTAKLEEARRVLSEALEGDAMRALEVLEKVTALQPAVSAEVRTCIDELYRKLFSCPECSRASIERDLREGPLHRCGLTFDAAPGHMEAGARAAAAGPDRVDGELGRKLSVFLSPAVRSRLEQGKAEPIIAKVLACADADALRDCLVPACLEDASVVEIINRYLKQVVVRKVRVADFSPSIRTVEREQIGHVVAEFRRFLEEQLAAVEGDENTLPMLQVE
jgi:hypothetical protein